MPDSNELSDPDVWKKWQAKKSPGKEHATTPAARGGGAGRQKHTHICTHARHRCDVDVAKPCLGLMHFFFSRGITAITEEAPAVRVLSALRYYGAC